ncbi:hypothetical protein D9Q98_001907 [Chlorella vulgaris]|uniref:Carbohydrate kinase PfkB domain-containing protein n=1 Tax=Chlorella vulgaris TaxID=3077 RepID=A0A9D4TVA5_CHLVU|nr:hypothetical protein D9Q98_001907 [Chlorella vulgaris]
MRMMCGKSRAAAVARNSERHRGSFQPAHPGGRHTGALGLCRSHIRSLPVELVAQTAGVDVQGIVAAQAAATAGEMQDSTQFDCLGLAQAMVDMCAVLDDDELLEQLAVEKGSRRLVSLEERAAVLERLSGREYAIAAAGSLSNTLLGLARLSQANSAAWGDAPLRVGMAGLVGSDPLGEYYTAQMRQAGVQVTATPLEGAATGTVTVLTSPDAQRTMLSYLGTAAEVAVDAALEAAIARSRLLVVEGYLWELPNAQRTITAAIAAAQRHGCVVAMTAGDAGVVQRHHEEIWAAIGQGIDLLFTNADEAAALLRYEPRSAAAAEGESDGAAAGHCATGEQLALRLGPHCSVCVVTDGAAGSYMTALGQLHCVPPCWTESAPVDTCGAGDAYAAGLLYGYLTQLDPVSMGRTAARVASAVISKHGATLTPEAALALVEVLPRAGVLRAAPAAASLAPSTPRV